VKYIKKKRDNECTVKLYNVYNIIIRRNLSTTSRKLQQLSGRVVSTYSSVQCLVRLARKCMEESCEKFVVNG